MKSAFKYQEGGSHYKDFPIQPLDFIVKNNLNWYDGSIVKYACRHKQKNGADDLKKVVHYALLELEAEYGILSEVKYSDNKEATKKHKRIHRVRRTPGASVEGVPKEPNRNIIPARNDLPPEAQGTT
jgi:hypothetical protein